MPTLSQAQIEMYARSAGLSPERARIAAAIAMAESGGRTDAHNATPPDDSYGLWQINMLGAMGPARRARLGISSNTALYDPAVNARAMAMISNGGATFQPWTTYTSGAYRRYLGAGGTADPAWWLPIPGGIGGVPIPMPDLPDLGGLIPDGGGDSGDSGGGFSLPDPFGGLADSVKGINAIAELWVGAAEWVAKPHNWVRTAQVGVGAVMVGVGLAVMTRGAWEPAAKAVATLTPSGRIAATSKATAVGRAVRTGGRGVKSAPKAKAAA